jgi:cobalamin synthase
VGTRVKYATWCYSVQANMQLISRLQHVDGLVMFSDGVHSAVRKQQTVNINIDVFNVFV